MKKSSSINFYDIFYIILLFMLIDNSISLVPESVPFKIFIYQLMSCIIMLFSIVIYRKIYIPMRLMIVYSLILVQSGLLILIGRVDTKIILRENIQLILLLIFAVVIYNYFSADQEKLLKIIEYAFYFWCVSALFFAVLNMVFKTDFGIYKDSYFPYPRLKGFNADPNVFGIYILTFSPLALYCSRRREKRKVLVLLITITCIILSFSRSNIILTGVFIIIYFIYGFYLKKVKKGEVFSVIIILALITLCLASITPLRNAFILRANQFMHEANINSDSRFGLWVKAFGLISKYPILGVGLDHPIFYIEKYIHNTFIEWIASCGVFGIIVDLFYICNLIKHLLRAKKSDFDFYMAVAYITHFLTISFVSELNFEPTFLLFALSQVNFNQNNMVNGEKKI